MKRSMLAFGTLAAVVAAAPAPAATVAVRGDYVEARTCDVYSGHCIANGEVNLTGDQAVLGWRIRTGAWGGTSLDGLAVLAIVKARATLGDPYANPLPARSVVVVDGRGDERQRAALVDLVRSLGGALLSEIVQVEARSIEFATDGAGTARVAAGDLVRLETRCLHGADHLCGNEEVYYSPLAAGVEAAPAYVLAHQYRGQALGVTWSKSHNRGAFVGTFER